MLAFFRKYQKGLFLVVGVVVLASFSFFGVQKTGFEKQIVEKDGDVGVAIDGSKIRLLELNRLKRFIRSDASDTQMLMAKDMPNMLNDGIIRTEFIESGLAKELLLAYKEDLKDEFLKKVTRHKRFKPYVHREAPFLSVEGLWSQIVPELKVAFETFKEIPPEDYEANVEALLTLYQHEQKLPPHMVKQFLHYQASQFKWVQPDVELINGTFSLFRAKHCGDWFGEQCIDLIAQTILNGAIVAKREGYTVTREEAKMALFENAKQAFAAQNGGKASDRDVATFVANQLQYLRLDEFDAVSIWQKVLLFKKYFQDIGSSVIVDTLSMKKYQEYLDKKVEKEVYHFSKPVAIRSFREMLGLQFYIDAVTSPQARKSMHPLDVPQVILSAEHVEKKAPELTAMDFVVMLRSAKKSDVLMEIPMQDVWALQLDETHFKKLQKSCNELSGKGYATEATRTEALEGLDDIAREKADHFTRVELFEKQPELLQQVLAQAEECEEKLSLSLGNVDDPLPGITNAQSLREMLLGAEEVIEGYTQDGENYYSITVKNKGDGLKLLSYIDAKKQGILDGLLTRHLEKQYALFREKNLPSFKDKEGNWKPFRAVYDEVGELAYKEVCDALDTFAKKKLTSEEYPKYRFAHLFDKMAAKLQKSAEANDLFSEGPWQLEKEHIVSVRSERGEWYDEAAFEMDLEKWSTPLMSEDGRPYIYQITATGIDESKLPELVEKEQKELAKEAKQELLAELITEMLESGAVHFLYETGN